MVTKSEIIAAVNGFITSVVNITKHRNSMLELINELWQTNTYQEITTAGQIQCHLVYKKQGNIVHLSGRIRNDKTSAVNILSNLITIPDSKLFGKTGSFFHIIANSSFDQPKTLYIDGNTIKNMGAISASTELYINSHYQVND